MSPGCMAWRWQHLSQCWPSFISGIRSGTEKSREERKSISVSLLIQMFFQIGQKEGTVFLYCNVLITTCMSQLKWLMAFGTVNCNWSSSFNLKAVSLGWITIFKFWDYQINLIIYDERCNKQSTNWVQKHLRQPSAMCQHIIGVRYMLIDYHLRS